LIKCLLKSLGQSSVLKYPSVCLEIRASLSCTLGSSCRPVPTPSSPAKVISPLPSQKSFEQRTNMAYSRRLTNIIGLAQGFPTFFLPCTPSAFRQMSMYPYSISTVKDVPLQIFERRTCTLKTPYDKIFSHDFSQIYLTINIQ